MNDENEQVTCERFRSTLRKIICAKRLTTETECVGCVVGFARLNALRADGVEIRYKTCALLGCDKPALHNMPYCADHRWPRARQHYALTTKLIKKGGVITAACYKDPQDMWR